MPRPPGKGRKKVEMRAIEGASARQVTFSKRRKGIFKKATELSVLCGAHVGAVVFSPAGRPYTFGNPSFERVLDRYLSSNRSPPPLLDHLGRRPVSNAGGKMMVPAEPEEKDVEKMGLEELREYEKELVAFNQTIERLALEAYDGTLEDNDVVTVADVVEDEGEGGDDVADTEEEEEEGLSSNVKRGGDGVSFDLNFPPPPSPSNL